MVNWFNDRRESFQGQVDDTYRGQLRELNELNFARFDAKLEQRLAEVKAGIAELRGEFRADLHDQGKMLIRWMFGFWITTVTTGTTTCWGQRHRALWCGVAVNRGPPPVGRWCGCGGTGRRRALATLGAKARVG